MNVVTRKLESIYKLLGEELDALTTMATQVADCRTGQELVREGDRPSRCFALLEGFACTFKLTHDGRRQIMAFHIPGDMPDLQSLHHKVADTSIATLTPCKIAFIEHEVVRDLCRRYPQIASVFWRETLNEASVYREWVTNIGQREGPARIAHLACEFLVRMGAAGQARDNTCQFPMTQTQLADATGMSTVHVNRSIQNLRAKNLITLKSERLRAVNWPALTALAQFDPTYLHLNEVD